MKPWERERLAHILRRLRAAPVDAEKEAAGLVERGEILPDESTYPFRHGWVTGVVKIAAEELAALLESPVRKPRR